MTLIKVTQADIDEGSPAAACNCPVARALNRQFGEWWTVAVTYAISNKGRRIALPRSAQRFIRRFDSIRDVKPFNFKLDTYA